jgi:hypothetical protein
MQIPMIHQLSSPGKKKKTWLADFVQENFIGNAVHYKIKLAKGNQIHWRTEGGLRGFKPPLPQIPKFGKAEPN